MLAGYWVAIDPQNNAYAIKEVYQSDLIISDAAKKIIEIENNDKVSLRYAPPDLYNRRQDTGKSAVDIFGESGLHFIKATNDRVQGWYNLKEWLKVIEVKDEQTGKLKKTSRLKFFSNCTNIIRTLPQLLRDEKNPNDVASEPHELTHGPDGIRYLLADRPPRGYVTKENDIGYDEDDEDNEDYNKRMNSFF